MLTAAATGFATGLSLIFVIGAQNAFVLQQGLMRAHVFWVCLTCVVSDALLISIGVAASGSISVAYPQAIGVLKFAGAAFLVVYGALSLRRAFRPGSLRVTERGVGSLRATLLTCLALTWLNPHVYLDTVGLIGAVSTGFSGTGPKVAFALGAILAEFIFFFSLGYGARLLAPVFARPGAWAVLDVLIALVMWSVAATLFLEF